LAILATAKLFVSYLLLVKIKHNLKFTKESAFPPKSNNFILGPLYFSTPAKTGYLRYKRAGPKQNLVGGLILAFR